MRNKFRGNLVLGALKKKKLLRLQKKHFFYHSWNAEKFFFCNFQNFIIKYYRKICLVIIIIFFLASIGKKIGNKNTESPV